MTRPEALTRPESRVRFADVGASGGLPEAWAEHAGAIDVIGFEPDATAFAELDGVAPHRRWFDIGLHRKAGTFEFHRTRKPSNSSCLRPNMAVLERFEGPDRFEVVAETTIECLPLDDAIADAKVDRVDFLKVDTQGTELDVLEGARETLEQRVFGVEVEVWFVEGYHGVPLHAEVDAFLRPLGFELVDLRCVSWKRAGGASLGGRRGQLVFADALYFKTAQTVCERPSEDTAAAVLRAIQVCLVYGFVDLALELLASTGSSRLTPADAREVEAFLRAQRAPGSGIPDFPGRAALARGLSSLAERLAPMGMRHSRKLLGNRLRTR